MTCRIVVLLVFDFNRKGVNKMECKLCENETERIYCEYCEERLSQLNFIQK